MKTDSIIIKIFMIIMIGMLTLGIGFLQSRADDMTGKTEAFTDCTRISAIVLVCARTPTAANITRAKSFPEEVSSL